MEAALKECADTKPLLYAVTTDNLEAMTALAKTYGCPVVAKAPGIDQLAALTEKLTQAGLKDIVLDSGSRQVKQAIEDQIIIRRLALTNKFRPLGFPTIVLTNEMA